MIVILALLSQAEFYGLLQKSGRTGYTLPGLVLGIALVLLSYFGSLPEFIFFALAFTALMILAELSRSPTMRRVAATFFGVLCVPFALSFIVITLKLSGDQKEGLFLAIWLILTAKITDVGGFLIGTTIGKRKMAPKISPNKTWEGAIGGIIAAGLTGAAYSVAFKEHLPQMLSPMTAVLLALPISMAAIVSDLIQSRLKRLAQEKDSGTIIPGIGGALDLADSLILSAPCGYVLIRATVIP